MKQLASQGGALLVLGFFFFGPLAQVRAQPVPLWFNKDIGSPAADGSLHLSAEEMVVSGAGEIGGARDEFHFVYQRIAGDVDVTVRVDALDSPHAAGRAGIMIRNGLGAGARHVFISVSQGKGVAFERRHVSRESTRRTQIGGSAAPLWLRLSRKGDHFFAYRSADGTSWTLASRDIVAMREFAYVGFAVASGSPERSASAVLANPTIDVDGQLPEPWATRQIGHTPQPGGADPTSGSFVVQGAGRGVGAIADRFRYVYQRVRGDVEIIAAVAWLAGDDNDALAGVMIRADLDERAVHATMIGRLMDGWQFYRRVVAGAKSLRTAGPGGRPPGWVKLVREGQLFSAFYSPDGVTWTLVDSDRIAMPGEVLVGLVVASGNILSLASASFTGVIVRSPVIQNDPPTVSIQSPRDGQQFEIGASISINATATDPGGAVTRVDFYRGATLLGTDSIAPYSATWKGILAGMHSLSAVARDTDGATATATVSIVVGSTPPASRTTLVFTPSADHAKYVSSYGFAVFRATDALSAPPVVKANLGKPTPVGGEISVDISALLATLQPGSYKAVVTAIGAGGSAASAPSPTFVR